MFDILIESAKNQGIWGILSCVLIVYILKTQEKRDLKQEEREIKYQETINKLMESLDTLDSINSTLDEIKRKI